MARYVVGFDCGGTYPRGVLVDESWTVLARAAAGPGNPLSAGMAVAARSYTTVFRRLLAEAGLRPRQIGAIGLGAAGAGRPAQQRQIRAVLRALAPAARIRIDSDGLIGLLGATLGRGGIIVIAGTGSFVLGVDRQRKQARGGGWGPLLGDEGSGATIGRAAIQAVLRAEDGRETPTKLRRIVFAHFGVRSCADLVTRIYAKPPTPSQFAELWPAVLRAARSGDPAARALLEHGGAELAATVEAVAVQLDFGAVDFPLILSGGVLQNDSPLRSTLLQRLRRTVPRARLAEPAAPPEMGAVFLVIGLTAA
jgi:N-acetylglucosamine kinase-like BadF-type ATPase